MAGNHSDLERRLWDAADELRANSKFEFSKCSVPVLGLIFVQFANNKFAGVEQALAALSTERRRRTISKTVYLARGCLIAGVGSIQAAVRVAGRSHPTKRRPKHDRPKTSTHR